MERKERGGEVSKGIEVLVDSDAFVGQYYPDDAHHEKAKFIFATLENANKKLVTTSLVVNEAATVLSHKSGQEAARKFLDTLDEIRFPVIFIDENLQKEAIAFFKRQTKKGTSIVDCSNVVVMGLFKIPTILSFDKFYNRHPQIQTPKTANLM